MGPAVGLSLEALKSLNDATGKNVPKDLLKWLIVEKDDYLNFLVH